MSNDDISTILSPYASKVKPLKLNSKIKEKESKLTKKDKPQEGWIRSAIRIWSNLRVKERKMILNTLKNIFIFILGLISSKKK